MLDFIRYVNHINEEIQFGSNDIYVNYNNLRDYSWDFTSQNSKVSSFFKGIVEKTIPIIINCQNEEEGIRKKNKLFEITEKDILALQHGRLLIGDYYLKCFITGSSKDNYLIKKGYLEANLTVIIDFPQWIKETITVFRPFTSENLLQQGKRNFDYGFDLPFDYTSEMKNKTLNNTGFISTNFKLIIYGPCINPAIHISGHTYKVNCEVSEKEYLTIDSLLKTIVLTRYNGVLENKFNKRFRESYIFEKIQTGNNIVTWNGEFGFDVILLEERSEPKWT